MQAWKTLSRRTILSHSKFLTVEDHTIELHDGRVIPNWPWIITPDFVNVLPETVEGQFLCFRQTKYGLQGTSLAPVGGYMEPGEDPLVAAKRELLEETGFDAQDWVSLGSFVLDPNRGLAIGHLYLARGARFVTTPHADDLEEQQLLQMSRSELETALIAGEFKALAWTTNVALALQWLSRTGPETKPGAH